MNLRQLEVFHAIIKAGSVTGAARDLCVTQPAISAVLKHTEQQLDMRLFERVSGRLQPTPEAMMLIPDVEAVFGQIDTIRRFAHDLRDGRAGQIVVATSPTLVNTLLPKAVAELRRSSPKLSVFLRSLSTPMAIDRVSRREADMGVIYGPVADPGVVSEPLIRSEIVCVVPKDHPFAGKPHVDAQMLAGESLISFGTSTFLGRSIVRTYQELGIPAPEVGIEASSSFTACLMVQGGAGVALIDQLTSLSYRFEGLTFLPFLPCIAIEVMLVFPRDRPRSRATRRLAEMLSQLAQGTAMAETLVQKNR
jgi:DNA-binding transcriptional LysR family regulator